MKITSTEIAKIANVSRSTVSRVINNYSNVPEKTRQKVLAVIEEYGYVPNSSARALVGKTNNIIALFIADIDNSNEEKKWRGANSPYFLDLISETINESKKYNYMVLVYVITNAKEYEQIEHIFANRTIYGGIFVGFEYNSPELKKLINKEYNMVFIDEISEEDFKKNRNLKVVNSKNKEGGYIATQYLIDKGHKYIAHIAGDNRLSSIERKKGYIKAMSESNLEIKNEYIIKGFYREEDAYLVTKQLLDTNKEITAIFVANDIMAIGSIKAIKERGLKIPEDISIIGFDNCEFSKYINIELTTMEVDIKELAASSVKLLLDVSNNNFIKCDSKIIERESVTIRE